MSFAKMLKKRLPTMTQTDNERLKVDLNKKLQTERNPMIRSSLKEQLRILSQSLTTGSTTNG